MTEAEIRSSFIIALIGTLLLNWIVPAKWLSQASGGSGLQGARSSRLSYVFYRFREFATIFRSWTRDNLNAVRLGLCLLIVLLLALILLRVLPGRFIGPREISCTLGVLVALACINFLRATEPKAPTAVLSFWFALIFIFGTLGLFADFARRIVSSLKEAKIETSAFSLTLKSPDGQVFDNVALSWDNDGKSLSSFQQMTSYQFATHALLRNSHGAKLNRERIDNICHLFDRSDCIRPEVRQAIDASIEYFKLLDPIFVCMKVYAEKFPNGLPLQKELSEIAVSYATKDWEPTSNNRSAAMSKQEDELKGYFDRLLRKVATSDSAACHELGEYGEKIYLDTLKALENWRTFKTLHRSLVEGYVMFAAGYPYDGTIHIQRDLGEHIAYFRNSKAGILGELIAILGYSELEVMYGFINEYDHQYDTQKKLYENYLHYIPPFFDDHEPHRALADFVNLCAQGAFNGLLAASEATSLPASDIRDPDCPIHASSFQSAIPVPFPVPPPATATPGIGAMPRPATARPVTQLGEAAVANASDGQSGSRLAAVLEEHDL